MLKGALPCDKHCGTNQLELHCCVEGFICLRGHLYKVNATNRFFPLISSAF